MREDAQAKTLPLRYKTEVTEDSGSSAVVQVLGQGQKKVNLFDSLILTWDKYCKIWGKNSIVPYFFLIQTASAPLYIYFE